MLPNDRRASSRFLDISVRLPELISVFEQSVSETLRKAVARGKVSTNITLTADNKTDIFDVFLDKSLLEKYLSVFAENDSISDNITVSDVVSLPEVLSLKVKDNLIERASPLIESAVESALKSLDEMRCAEGKAIEKDLLGRIEDIEKKLFELSKLLDTDREAYLQKLRERMAEILGNEIEIDESRLAQEAAMLASKSDIAEEITRLKSHTNQFRHAIQSEAAAGSKLKFILQECNREADTIGAKGNSTRVAELTIEIKEQLERIREQVQNVE